MPDLPGGPIDPDLVLRAIAAGAEYDAGRFTFGTVAVVRFGLETSGPIAPRWHLSTAGSIGVTAETFAVLQTAEAVAGEPGYLRAGRLRYVLADVDGMAELLPA